MASAETDSSTSTSSTSTACGKYSRMYAEYERIAVEKKKRFEEERQTYLLWRESEVEILKLKILEEGLITPENIKTLIPITPPHKDEDKDYSIQSQVHSWHIKNIISRETCKVIEDKYRDESNFEITPYVYRRSSRIAFETINIEKILHENKTKMTSIEFYEWGCSQIESYMAEYKARSMIEKLNH